MRTESDRRLALPTAAALALLIGFAAPPVRAALWESSDWALTGTVNGAVGYDSNITLSRNGPEDMFIRGQPQLTFSRRNSQTDFHTDASVTGTEFVNGRQPFQTDVYIGANYAYPFVQDVIPLYKSLVSWQRSSEPDPYLGHRVLHNRFDASAEGYMSLTGKLGVRGAIDGYVDNYVDPTLNHNNRWRVFTGLTYEARPGLQGSLNVGYAEGESQPNHRVAGTGNVHSREYYTTLRFLGKITPKITGSVYGGFGQVTYRGGYHNRYNLPIAGADLTWSVDPRRTVVLAAYSGADYAPDGQAVNTSRAFLSFTDVVIGHWQAILRAGPTHTVFRREVRQSTDNSWEGSVEFAYVPSEVFRVGAGITYDKHDSDVRDRQYDRALFTVESSYHF